jgi:hypothetical protein
MILEGYLSFKKKDDKLNTEFSEVQRSRPTLKYYPDTCEEQVTEEMKNVHTHRQIRTLFILNITQFIEKEYGRVLL